MLVVGNKMYERCARCHKLICLNKWIIGDLHFCLANNEIKSKK